MSNQLILHCGAREIQRDDLQGIEAPPPTETWYPVKHAVVLDAVTETLAGAGFAVARSWLSVAHENQRFFGVLDLDSQIVEGVHLAVGIRNSNDKSFPLGFCCGSRTFVCDNLAFDSEVVISKRHTRHGSFRYSEGIATAVAGLTQYRSGEAQRIEELRARRLSKDRANSVLLQAYERGIVGARLLPDLIQEWREPRHEAFRPRTAYSLLNCYTEIVKPRFQSQPQRSVYEMMQFQRLLLN
jgi:hypothetical protein